MADEFALQALYISNTAIRFISNFESSINFAKQDMPILLLTDDAGGSPFTIALLVTPILIELALISGFCWYLISSTDPHCFGLSNIFGATAACIAAGIYLSAHGRKPFAMIMGFLLTPIWVLLVFNIENHFPNIDQFFAPNCQPISSCSERIFPNGHISWGWSMFTFLTLVASRYSYYRFVSDAKELQHTSNTIPATQRLIKSAAIWSRKWSLRSVIVLSIFSFSALIIKSCESTLKAKDKTNERQRTSAKRTK